MADNPDDDSSSSQRTVILRDWWLIKCSNEFEGKRFGVSGTQIAAETRAMRVFTSSPIIKAFDVFTLEASNGVCIILRGFLNKQRLLQSGFLPQISRDFIFGFPPCWEAKCNNCFVGVPSGAASNTVIGKASRTLLSPCNNTKWNLDDSPAESRDESTVIEKNSEESTDKDGRHGVSVAKDEKPARKKSLRLQSKSVKVSEVQNTTNDGNHGSEGLSKAKSGGVKKDECEVISNEVISPEDGCGKKLTSADKVTSMSATEESLILEQGEGELEATKECPHSLSEDLEQSGKRGKKAVSKKSGKILRSDGNVVEHVNHSGTKFRTRKNKRKLDVSEVQSDGTNSVDHGSESLNKAKGNDIKKVANNNEETSPVDGRDKTCKNAAKESLSSEQRKGKLEVANTFQQSLSKEASNSSKPGKKGKSKKSEKILKGDCDVVEQMTHSGSKVKGNLSGQRTNRKINFDEEVTPDRDVKKQMFNAVSTDSLGQKRSRSGRVLVSSLEFWRNQVPVYDVGRNLIQVNEGHETNSTPSKGKVSVSQKLRR